MERNKKIFSESKVHSTPIISQSLFLGLLMANTMVLAPQTVIVINVNIDKLHSGDDEVEIRHVNVFS